MKLTIDFQVRYASFCETYDLGNKYERKKGEQGKVLVEKVQIIAYEWSKTW